MKIKKLFYLLLTIFICFSMLSLTFAMNIDSSTEYENKLKEEAKTKSIELNDDIINTEQINEIDVAYENMIIRENYVVNLVIELSGKQATFKDWEDNLDYLINNYDKIKEYKNVNMEYVDIYIQEYSVLRTIEEENLPDEKIKDPVCNIL